VCQAARHLGMEFFAFSRSSEHQELARKLGASWAGRADEKPPRLVDRAIIFAPTGKSVLDALRHVRKGGTIAINAVYMDPVPEIDYNQLLFGEKTVRSVSNLTREDAKEFLELAPKIPIRSEVEIFEFNNLPNALLKLKQGKVKAAAVLKIS
jgi:propanol-preferring alcohol dehydrogenase